MMNLTSTPTTQKKGEDTAMIDDPDPGTVRQIRIRKFVDTWFIGFVAVLVIIGVIGAGLVYTTHVDPAIETEKETVVTWQESTEQTHQAEVQRQNPVFAVGQVLSGRPTYFTTLTPEVENTHQYTYDAAESGELNVEMTALLRIQSVNQDGYTYWNLTEELSDTRQRNISPNDTASMSFIINISDVASETTRIERGVGAGVGTVETDVIIKTTVEGSINGKTVQQSHQDQLSLNVGRDVYSVESNGGTKETHEIVNTTEYEATYGPLRSYGSFLIILFSMSGLAGLAVLRRSDRLAPSQQELSTLERQRVREKFDDWISPGRVPEEMLVGPWVELDSLEDLVDVAVDANQRVLEDTDRNMFFVVEDDRCYTDAESADRLDTLGSAKSLDQDDTAHSHATSAEPSSEGEDESGSDTSDTETASTQDKKEYSADDVDSTDE